MTAPVAVTRSSACSSGSVASSSPRSSSGSLSRRSRSAGSPAVRCDVGPTDLHEPVGVVQTALLGFVGLILAFGLALAVGRYETRRASVVEEANAIGTTYLRAQTLAEPMRSRSLELLTDYTDSSIRLAQAVPSSVRREERPCRRPEAAARAVGPRGPLARRRPDRKRAAAVRRDAQPDDRPADRAQGGPEQSGAAGGALVRAGERDDRARAARRSTSRCSTAASGRC